MAVRVESSPGCGLPLLCELGSEKVTLLAPDADVRQEWLTGLATTARNLLRPALPAPTVDGQRIDRPTLLPVPGEIPDQNPIAPRLRRLGKLGRALLDQATNDTRSAANDAPAGEPIDEHRLLFDYLRGDYSAALADLDLLESRAETEELRFRLLGLRAQTLSGARPLGPVRSHRRLPDQGPGARLRRVEETPLGLVFSPADDPGYLWPRYLAQRLAAKPAQPASPTSDPVAEEDNAIDLRMPNLIEGIIRREIDAGGGLPFPRPVPTCRALDSALVSAPDSGPMADAPAVPRSAPVAPAASSLRPLPVSSAPLPRRHQDSSSPNRRDPCGDGSNSLKRGGGRFGSGFGRVFLPRPSRQARE